MRAGPGKEAAPTGERFAHALPYGLGVVFALVGLVVARDPTSLHDEGLLTFAGARALGGDFLPDFFFQKTHPPLSLVYSPVAYFGLPAFLFVHVLLAAATIPLLAKTATALGIRSATFTSLTVASAPVYFWCAASGISNSDGVFGSSLVLYLLATRRAPFVAGALLGSLVWVRYELALFVALLGVYVVFWQRSRPMLLGLCAWPVAYLVSGAVYHSDLLWALHFPPSIATPNTIGSHIVDRHDASSLVSALFGVTPMIFLLPFVRLAFLSRLEKVMLAGVLLNLGLFTAAHALLLHIGGPLWMFGASPRYALQALPFVAVLAARAVDRFGATLHPEPTSLSSSDLAALAGLSALGGLVHIYRGGDAAIGMAAAVGGAFTLSWLGNARASWPIAVAVSALPILIAPALAGEGFRFIGELPRIVSALETTTNAGGAVFTNLSLLAPYAERTGSLQGRPVRFLLQGDQIAETSVLLDAANGQRERASAALFQASFGDFVDPRTLDPAALTPGTVFALRDDERNELSLPGDRWAPYLEEIYREDRFFLARIKPRP